MTQEPGASGIPQSITWAVRMMYAGAVIGAIGFIIALTQLGSLREQVTEQLKAQGRAVDPAVVDTSVNVGIAAGVIVGLIGAGVWVWMALMNQRGRSWARILGTVFFGLATLGVLTTLAGASQATGVTKVFNILSWLVGLGAVFFMWKKESAPHYQQQKSTTAE